MSAGHHFRFGCNTVMRLTFVAACTRNSKYMTSLVGQRVALLTERGSGCKNTRLSRDTLHKVFLRLGLCTNVLLMQFGHAQ